MAFYGKSKYNGYRKRVYNLTDRQRRLYAQDMQDLEDYLQSTDYSYSSSLDSIYKNYPNFELRLSNHSADNKYHDIYTSSTLLVNVRCSKLAYREYIEKKVPVILNLLSTFDLSKYRYINIVNDQVNCYLKSFKTKKEKFTIKYWQIFNFML